MLKFLSDYGDDGSKLLLDANENAFGPCFQPDEILNLPNNITELSTSLPRLHRYPDPHLFELKQQFCNLRNTHFHTSQNITPENLHLGVGSDGVIDALIRCFCIPGSDYILICPPTYGIYAVAAQLNDVGVVKVPLLSAPDFSIDVESMLLKLSSDSSRIKIIFLCSPGNPTGSLLKKDDVKKILECPGWNGIVVLDEAYIDFASEKSSLAEWVVEWQNFVVMQTLSKGFGLAGIRLGVAFTSSPIAALLNNSKFPYNIGSLTVQFAMKGLGSSGLELMKKKRNEIFSQRDRLLKELPKIKGVGRLRGGVVSNFLLYEILDLNDKPCNSTALRVYEMLAESRGVVVRFRGMEHECLGCLRITVGTEDEVTVLLRELKNVLEMVHLAQKV